MIGAPAPHRPRPIWRRPLFGAAAAAVLALAALGGVLLYGQGTEPVSAEEIVERAQSVAADSTATGVRSYHQRATLTERKSGIAVTSSIEQWYGGTGRFRQERQTRNAAGAVTTYGIVINGTNVSEYTTEGSRTSVQRGNLDNPENTDRKFAPGNGITGLSDLLTQGVFRWQYGNNPGCATARQQSDGTVAGRSVYVIEVTRTSNCPTRPGQAPISRSVMSVDKETFFTLKTENYTTDGSLVMSHETTSIEYNVTIPDSTFTYTPPPGATVTTPSKPSGQNPTGQTLLADVDPECAKREIAAGRQSAIETTCRRPTASPAPTPSPRR